MHSHAERGNDHQRPVRMVFHTRVRIRSMFSGMLPVQQLAHHFRAWVLGASAGMATL